MLILQSVIIVLTYILYGIELTYINLSQYWNKSDIQINWERLFTELIHYSFFASNFYI
jgi:hypothetical protein